MSSKIKNLEKATFEENDSPELPPPDIVAFNESRSCADLYRMHQEGTLNIKPEFQREIIWSEPMQTRFIDSLTKELPIPSMCFSLDYRTLDWQVIDGLQRMACIIRFLECDVNWRLSRLDDINENLSGVYVKDIHDKKSHLNIYYKRIANLTLPITVIRCDYSKKSHTNYLFTIFHRLNTGGLKLNNQEIRNCIYSGRFNNLLNELNTYRNWLKLNRMKSASGYRFTKQELILRFFVFYYEYKNYGGRLAKYLNEYMSDHRNINNEEAEEKTHLFKSTVDIAYLKLFDGKTPPKMPISLLEATLVGIANNLRTLNVISPLDIKKKFKELQQHEEFSDIKLSEGLSGKQRVINRMSVAINIFS